MNLSDYKDPQHLVQTGVVEFANYSVIAVWTINHIMYPVLDYEQLRVSLAIKTAPLEQCKPAKR